LVEISFLAGLYNSRLFIYKKRNQCYNLSYTNPPLGGKEDNEPVVDDAAGCQPVAQADFSRLKEKTVGRWQVLAAQICGWCFSVSGASHFDWNNKYLFIVPFSQDD